MGERGNSPSPIFLFGDKGDNIMITQTTMYNVKNRSSSMVVYRIPETNLRREFAPGETKRVPFGELEKLTY